MHHADIKTILNGTKSLRDAILYEGACLSILAYQSWRMLEHPHSYGSHHEIFVPQKMYVHVIKIKAEMVYSETAFGNVEAE